MRDITGRADDSGTDGVADRGRDTESRTEDL